MAPITERHIRRLARFEGGSAPVTSLYLDVDGRRHPRPADLVPHLDALLRQARNGPLSGLDRPARASVEADLDRLEARVRRGFDRSRVRGVAMFSCSARSWWEVVELAVPVRNRVVVHHRPYVRELERVVDHHERFAVVLADRQRARVLLFHQGELLERAEATDELPRGDDGGVGRRDQAADQAADHAAAAARQHLRHAAELAFGVHQQQGFDHLVLGCPDELAGALERELHPWLAGKVATRISVPVGAPEPDIVAAALAAEEEVEARRHAEEVARWRAAVGSGGACAGLEASLAAVVERRVETLLVSEGYEAPGWRCGGCRWLGTLGRSCPVCGAAMVPCPDVVEEACEEALGQSCRVVICAEADLDVGGRIGALLRF